MRGFFTGATILVLFVLWAEYGWLFVGPAIAFVVIILTLSMWHESKKCRFSPNVTAVANQTGFRAPLSHPSPRRTVSTITAVPTGPVVTNPSSLQWKAIGHDLILGNPESFDPKKFVGLVDTFASAVRSGKNKSLVEDLKVWAENPRSARLTSATVESLLRWTTTDSKTWKASVPYAYDVWAYLFGTPAPTWKNWNHGERRYELDTEGWRKWLESLSGAKQ
jgi:hypothetical protein